MTSFADLRPFSFDLIMADPPWTFELYSDKGEEKSPQAQYDCMSLDEIKAMPVGHLATKDCILFLWCTWPLIDGGMEVLRHWGFRYVTGGAWHKKTVHGKTAFGTGYRVRCACEPFLIGVMGNPDTSKAERNVIEGLAREHSRKPDEAYDWCERYLPAAERLDLFSRQKRPGWLAWGKETDKFPEVAA